MLIPAANAMLQTLQLGRLADVVVTLFDCPCSKHLQTVAVDKVSSPWLRAVVAEGSALQDGGLHGLLQCQLNLLPHPGVVPPPPPCLFSASWVPIRPSAHATRPRISGSSSFSAAASTGTASGEPQLLSATATLRSSPRRLARLIGEFLKRRENSSWSMAISSISLAPCTPAAARTLPRR